MAAQVARVAPAVAAGPAVRAEQRELLGLALAVVVPGRRAPQEIKETAATAATAARAARAAPRATAATAPTAAMRAPGAPAATAASSRSASAAAAWCRSAARSP